MTNPIPRRIPPTPGTPLPPRKQGPSVIPAKRRTPYDALPLVPVAVARAVCDTPYTQQEFSPEARSPDSAALTEQRRGHMTTEAVTEFVELCDQRCRRAYAVQARWFTALAQADDGPERLSGWLTHWLVAYLGNPEQFRRRCAGDDKSKENP